MVVSEMNIPVHMLDDYFPPLLYRFAMSTFPTALVNSLWLDYVFLF